jgi:His-Xaa-Ser system radical SAM maturase HxsC
VSLSGNVQCFDWIDRGLLKVASLQEFACGQFPIDRMVLDLRSLAVGYPTHALKDLPWAGFVVDQATDALENRPTLAPDAGFHIAPGDVIEVSAQVGKASIRFKRGGNGNILFATERCNSNCLMCSQPPREVDDAWRVDYLCRLVELIDRDAPILTITGGEPTLLGDGLQRLLAHVARYLPRTYLQVLSNGRNLAEQNLAQSLIESHPSAMWCVPLYGDTFELHDYIVQRKGAFAQTIRGLFSLDQAGGRVEIRVVMVRPVVDVLPALARYIYRNFPFVEHVALMGTEPTGFAKGHFEDLWMDPVDMHEALKSAVGFLVRRGIRVSLYNTPLCTLPRGLWPHARKSISDWKQTFHPSCKPCVVKDSCAGFFAWATPKWTSRAISPISEEATCANR